jgi:hypothetical protein
LPPLRSAITFSAAVSFAVFAAGQVAENPDKETVRVTVSLNADELDGSGRFVSGVISDGAGQFRFKTLFYFFLYKYDAAGRLQEERI